MTGAAPATKTSPIAVLAAVGGLYVAQSVIGGITWAGLPAVMRNEGVSLAHIGWTQFIAVPWVLKFLWSPAIERFRLPADGRDRTGLVVLIGGLISIAAFIAVGLIGVSSLPVTFAILMVVAFAAATVDIACDGYAVQNLSKAEHGWGNAAQVGGAYIGFAIGGGLFLVLVGFYDWRIAIWSMAALLLVLGVPLFMSQASPAGGAPHQHVPSLLTAIKRPEVRRCLVACAIYVLAQKTHLGMLSPFLIDKGLDLVAVGVLNGVGSLIVGAAGALVGGALVRYWGVRTVLVLALVLQVASLLFFVAYDIEGGFSPWLLIGVAMFSSNAVMAIGFVALYALFMRSSDPRQAGVDFTIFQCMDAFVSIIFGIAAGYAAQAFGYGIFFAGIAVIAALAIPTLIVVLRETPAPQSA